MVMVPTSYHHHIPAYTFKCIFVSFFYFCIIVFCCQPWSWCPPATTTTYPRIHSSVFLYFFFCIFVLLFFVWNCGHGAHQLPPPTTHIQMPSNEYFRGNCNTPIFEIVVGWLENTLGSIPNTRPVEQKPCTWCPSATTTIYVLYTHGLIQITKCLCFFCILKYLSFCNFVRNCGHGSAPCHPPPIPPYTHLRIQCLHPINISSLTFVEHW